MLASPCSSRRAQAACGRARGGRASSFRAWSCVLLLSCLLGACATVRPAERERLADPAMAFEERGFGARHEQHVVDNREGSTGGGTAKGGGCGCN